MVTGFLITSYAIVANDAIQTLGTFLSSNAKRPWWILWLYACSILVAVLVYSWFVNDGDVSYGRIEIIPFSDRLTGIYLVSPIALLLLTQLGIPVSTTFLILTVFSPKALAPMLTKSLFGYVVAFLVSLIVYKFITNFLETKFIKLSEEGIPPSPQWVILQWISTGFLWSQWLIQDLVNIFVYLPRNLSLLWLSFSILLMLLLHAYIFYRSGGAIQKIVTSKTNTTDIRSATMIDFIYGMILLFFKELSKIPMSTTWVFLGLLAGREIAMTLNFQAQPMKETRNVIAGDIFKAFLGLAISIILATFLNSIKGVS